MVVRRVSRARSLRWAAGVHLVTLVVLAVAALALVAIAAAPARPEQRRPAPGASPAPPLTSENHFHQ